MKKDKVIAFKSLAFDSSSCKPRFFLVFMFVLGIVIRFSLSFSFRHGPTVQIDESLYINIAKSLAAGEGISYRSQPVPYMYIFYPLLLVPLYLFPLSFDLYRVIQLYNAVLISTSVFPIYLFARDFTGSRKKAVLSSALTLFMPDMLMSGFLMSECVVWPLSLWLIFFACRLFIAHEKHLFHGIMTGFFTALLFWTKPGAIAMGFVLLLSALFLGEKHQLQNRRTAALAGFSVCFGLVALFYILYVFVFGYDMSVLGLYNKQLTTISLKWILAVAEFSLLQLFLFAIACGGLFFVLPFVCFREVDESKRQFLSAFTLGLVIMAVGTAALVDMHTWNGSFTNPQLHLRYMAMFVPVMVVFSLSVHLSGEKKHCLLFALCALAIFVVFPGASVGFAEGSSTYFDSLALSAWISNFGVPAIVGTILTVFMVLFFVFLSFLLFKNSQPFSLYKLSLVFLVVFLLCNNVCGYIACSIHKDLYHYGQDAVEMNTVIESIPQDVLIVTQQDYDETVSYLLESRLRKPMQQVTVDAFMAALSETEGIYIPFIPADQAPNVGNHVTPDTDTFLFGIAVTSHLELSSEADLRKSSGGWFTLAQVSEGSRIVDTMLIGLNENTLYEGEQAQLYIFDTSRYKNNKLTLHISACAKDGSADLEVFNAGKTQTITLSEKSKICLISLREGDTRISARNGDVLISSYWTN